MTWLNRLIGLAAIISSVALAYTYGAGVSSYHVYANREFNASTQQYQPPYLRADHTDDHIERWTIGLGVTFALLYALYFNHQKQRKKALAHCVALLVCYALQLEIASIIKRRVGALRPNGAHGSFPSEHTAGATCVCSYFLLGLLVYVNHQKWWGVNLLLLTGLLFFPWWVAASRIISNHHYAADVVGGYVLALHVTIPVFWIVHGATETQEESTSQEGTDTLLTSGTDTVLTSLHHDPEIKLL